MTDFIVKIGGTGTSLSQAESDNNAIAVAERMRTYGFSDVAIAGMLGCFQEESTINPGIYETSHGGNLNNLPYFPGGMGIAQWTDYPAYTSQYPNPLPWSADRENKEWYNGDFQCWLCTKADDTSYTSMGYGQGPRWGWQTSATYPSISFDEYKKYNGEVRQACIYWFYCFEWHYSEIPDWVDLDARIRYAEYYYNIIGGKKPVNKKKMSIMLMLKRRTSWQY